MVFFRHSGFWFAALKTKFGATRWITLRSVKRFFYVSSTCSIAGEPLRKRFVWGFAYKDKKHRKLKLYLTLNLSIILHIFSETASNVSILPRIFFTSQYSNLQFILKVKARCGLVLKEHPVTM